MTKIIVGVDGSEAAKGALRWAAAEARLRGQPLVAVMAWGFLDQHHQLADAPFDPAYDDAEAHRALAAYVTHVLGPDATDDVELRPVCDLAAPALIDASADASLLVVGARGLGGFARLLLGSVTRKVLHEAACPVAVIRGDDRSEPAAGRVVVGTDGSKAADLAVAWALEEARLRGASLEVVHAWHLPYLVPYPSVTVALDTAPFEETAAETLKAAIARLDPRPDDRITTCVSMTGAAGLLLQEAEGAELVVVGSRGLGAVKRAVLGSVSHQVAQHASCPVVVVPDEHEQGGAT